MMWYVYILRLKDDSLYTGITKDIQRRIEEHEDGRGSKYVRGRTPVKLVHSEERETMSEALKREAEIKRWSKSKKEDFVKKNGCV
ncbi:MAG: GIY-YIG nuclease family protein [Candidatus Saliniplasma sp.]